MLLLLTPLLLLLLLGGANADTGNLLRDAHRAPNPLLQKFPTARCSGGLSQIQGCNYLFKWVWFPHPPRPVDE